MNKYGKKIKQARINKGYTQNQLADKLFVTKQSISKYENNHAEPSEDIKNKLEELLDIKLLSSKDKYNIKNRRMIVIFSSVILLLMIGLGIVGVQLVNSNQLYSEKSLQYQELNEDYQNQIDDNERLSNIYESLHVSYNYLMDDYVELELDYEELYQENQEFIEQNTLDYYGISFTYRDSFEIIDDYLYIDLVIHNTTDSQYMLWSELFSINDLTEDTLFRLFDDSTNNGWIGKGIVSNESYTCTLRVEVTKINAYFDSVDEVDLYFSNQFITRIDLNSKPSI